MFFGNLVVPNQNSTYTSIPEGIHPHQKNTVPEIDSNSNLESVAIVEDFDSIFQTDTLKSSSRN